MGGFAALVVIAAAISGSSVNADAAAAAPTLQASVAPSTLPAETLAPAGLRLDLDMGSGMSPPTAITLMLDNDLAIDVDGLPTCPRSALEAVDNARAERACRPAIVGRGTEDIEVTFQGSAPVRAQGDLIVFNGGVRHGQVTWLVHDYIDLPIPTAIVTEMEVRSLPGPFGTRLAMRIPTIAGGAGRVTSLRLRLGKRFSAHGERKSVIGASCPAGTLRFRAYVRLGDGSFPKASTTFACKRR